MESQITSDELVWALRVAPVMGRQLGKMWNEVYLKGVRGQELEWDKSWNTVFQARLDLLEKTVVIYMLGKLFCFLGSESRTVVLVPYKPNIVLATPIAPAPFVVYLG